ncbi:A-kinase anchor protein 200-like isoform X2 [Daktulosphaira vitifoliae]|uniref:A-kinase anchor protein 200-like isoform X2 n=1 Tax=Daktulosphaira vitifoliae TaxID=58002 RepID=UPI0021AA019D|nr:A-kinase anchor protein 200-like isoform X2 [Daktulosphaira vitifoliae]
MGARQSKRSVDISAGATKAEKGPSGEPLENGTITSASVDEKQIVEANGGTVEETPKQNGSTPHVNEKENNETATAPAEEAKEPVKVEEEKSTEPVVPAAETNGDLDTTADESVKSPTEESATTDEAEKKKRKKKKAWSFRSISFSKKDKSKPANKQSPTKTKDAVLEVAEDEVAKEEETETSAAVEAPKVEEKAKEEPEVNSTQTTEVPPPLPSSPPPVEAPIIEQTSAPVETVAPVETPSPPKPEEKPDILQPEQSEDDTVGGGEGLAEPPEGLNTSDIEKEVAEVPLVNGNHVEHEESLPSSPNVTEKIEAIKISNAIESNDVHHEISHEVNGINDAVAVSNSNEVTCSDANCNGTDD